MLIAIELLFLVTGLWALVSGKFPAGLFKLLFGKGEYDISPNNARLFGFFLMSPLPAVYCVLVVAISVPGPNGVRYVPTFEYIYLFTVAIASIIIARKIKRPEQQNLDSSQD